ncbi:hypothetical protein MHY87_03735 [Microvirga sp. ACRRW]|uniref:hypothetical protein n=1 Tax=Microvirga sp. ACRRW TaxID=2918205 RepID=UPI001EF44BA8|nr:hypothetical protein [Microvirga sp. ACRRW]MCG7392011.1 hypothetical protein [Microvirga sp. ACRRW]
MEQVAREDSELDPDRVALESRAQKVRRLEELIRAKEASGDRIVIGIGAALVVSSMALPVYASFVRDPYIYLPSVGGSIASLSNMTAERMQLPSLSDAKPVKKESAITRSSGQGGKSANAGQGAGTAAFARYVIHRATEASALIEGPSGLWWVTPGMKIPGAGQILSIEHSDAGWAVVTSETTITEGIAGNATN